MNERRRETFPRRCRIVRRSDYLSIYQKGRRVESRSFVLFGLRNALGHPRLGITVSRKVGGAVVRNRVKRLLREVFRRSRKDEVGPVDLVINARKPSAQSGYEELRREYAAAVGRLRIPAPQASPTEIN